MSGLGLLASVLRPCCPVLHRNISSHNFPCGGSSIELNSISISPSCYATRPHLLPPFLSFFSPLSALQSGLQPPTPPPPAASPLHQSVKCITCSEEDEADLQRSPLRGKVVFLPLQDARYYSHMWTPSPKHDGLCGEMCCSPSTN